MLYIPITYCSYLADELLFQRAAAGVHAVNVRLHTANTALVLMLCRRLGLAVAGTAVATLLFALHPVQVEPVAWAVDRGFTRVCASAPGHGPPCKRLERRGADSAPQPGERSHT